MSAQERIIEERIGNVDFAIPREFVTLWPARSRGTPKTFVQVAFGYPQPEPLGTWGFDHDATRWAQAQKALLERGLRILTVELDGQHAPKPEQYPWLDSMCRAMSGQSDSRHSHAIEISVCLKEGRVLAGAGRSDDGESYFRLDPYTGAWRLFTFDKRDRVRTRLDLSPESLQDWRALLDYSKKVVGAWRK